ncbi:duodenase-1-like [Archocentrus centrarchus]|uniref:duodenase-1-like n=1 Tax=Archocentrus centrarchus TaxID=63155 RepID=UPI0011EA2748|nr:duodenase-1-like [Archocentrus centrarchus]
MRGLQKLLLFYILPCLGQLGHGSDIIHGKKSPENEMLFMASVQNTDGHVCGGFLITEDFVVTAAHCDDSSLRHVVLGTHNLKEYHEKIEIEKKIKYEDYKNVEHGNDIMLLKLSKKVLLGSNIQIIQLPHAEMNLEENEVCQVAGWGLTENGILPHELRVVDVSVINPQSCMEQWSPWLHLPANVICAGGYGTNKGFCQGDSGGPLVCKGLAVGIVSFNKNLKCTYPDVPNVYMDLSKYGEWIDKILTSARHFK